MAWQVVPESDRQRMITAYLSGLSAEKSAALVGRDRKTCVRALKKAGIPLRERQGRCFGERTCRFCERLFVPTSGSQTTCDGEECRRRGVIKRNADYVARHPGRKSDSQRERYQKMSSRQKWARWLRAGYGIGLDVFDALVVGQCGRCKVCLGELRDLHIDHCHKTGRVRGLLCRFCNLAAGFLRDRPEVARNIALYLGEQSREDGDSCADTAN